MKKQWIEQLAQMEHEFCRASSERGAGGWASYFAADGVMVGKLGDPIRGPEAIRAAMEAFFSVPENRLTWEPMYCDVAEDGSLGYTYGRYLRRTQTPEGLAEETGKYMTLWRRQVDGQWLIEADIGN